MRYRVLACDYDGTLAQDGRVDEPTVAALAKCRASGRKLVLVTGRELDELQSVFGALELFECVVAENGALLYWPATKQEKPLADRPPDEFIQTLRDHGVPCSVGRVIVATWVPHDKIVLETIHQFGLELHMIFNKGAVMILPSGVNKASGLAAALADLRISSHNVVAVGDAENDHALLASCEVGVAVANALPTLKERADLVTTGDHGRGVTELIGMLLADDLASLEHKLTRHCLLIGHTPAGDEVHVHAYEERVLVTGRSGSGKSTLTAAFIERLVTHQYQFCVIDPEGDYDSLHSAVTQGNRQQAPEIDQLAQVLEKQTTNASANLMGVPLDRRPREFLTLLSKLLDLRARYGHPHWIIVDEAHHVLPASWKATETSLPERLESSWFVTLESNLMNRSALAQIDTVIATGADARELLKIFCDTLGEKAPPLEGIAPKDGEAIVWRRHAAAPALVMRIEPGDSQRRRHSRKYAEGEIEEGRSFYFRGPKKKLNLRAQNLRLFLQMGDGVDDETWLYHLRQGDYSGWFRQVIKDEALANATAELERSKDMSPAEGRQKLREFIEEHYVLPLLTDDPPPGV